MEPSPPRPLPSSPKHTITSSLARRPLQERSESESNERIITPTIRVVADPGPSVWSKSPFPTKASQILPPNYASRSLRPDRPHDVSDENTPTNALTKAPSDEALVPRPLQPQKSPSNRASTDSTASEADTSTNYGSSLSPTLSSRYSQTTSPPSTPTLISRYERLSGNLPPLPETVLPGNKSTIRLVNPSRSNDRPPLSDQLYETPSISASSPDPVTAGKEHRRSSSASSSSNNYQIIASSSPPREDAPPSSPIYAKPQFPSSISKRAASPPKVVSKPSLNFSAESLALSDASYSAVPVDNPHSASSSVSLSYATSKPNLESGVDVQYPTVQPPSSSSSWATVSTPSKPAPPSRMNDDHNRPSQWSSRLSTIPSESDRLSGDLSRAQSPQRLRRVIGSIVSSSEGTGPLSSQDSITIPQPLFFGNRQLPTTRGRDSEEGDDTLGELQSPPLRAQRSGYLARIAGLSRPTSSESMKSQISFAGDLSWAKTYYSSGEWPALINRPYGTSEPSTSRINTATSGPSGSPLSENFPAEIYRPRNRAREEGRGQSSHSRKQQRRGTSTRGSATPSEAGTWAERLRRPFWNSSGHLHGSGVFSPHLHRDRRDGMGLTMWNGASFDEPFTTNFFKPVNRQIIMFLLGFIFPFSWFLAAILPLPDKPASFDPHGDTDPMERGRGNDVYLRTNPGALLAMELEERRYQKARWWRTLNRFMCVAGLAIIGAIIALVVIALHK